MDRKGCEKYAHTLAFFVFVKTHSLGRKYFKVRKIPLNIGRNLQKDHLNGSLTLVSKPYFLYPWAMG